MNVSSWSASRLLSRPGRSHEKCLLWASKTSSASLARKHSTSAHQCLNASRRPSQARQSVYSGTWRSNQISFLNYIEQVAQTQARRRFSISATSQHNHLNPPKPGEELHVTFTDKEGEEHTFEVATGDNLLDIAQDNDIEMEGACGGSCACSTCHVIVEDEDLYNKMDEPDDDENDMLDLAFGLTETSRLGCQVKMRPDLEGLRVRLPSMTRNMQASDFSKK